MHMGVSSCEGTLFLWLLQRWRATNHAEVPYLETPPYCCMCVNLLLISRQGDKAGMGKLFFVLDALSSIHYERKLEIRTEELELNVLSNLGT